MDGWAERQRLGRATATGPDAGDEIACFDVPGRWRLVNRRIGMQRTATVLAYDETHTGFFALRYLGALPGGVCASTQTSRRALTTGPDDLLL